MSYEELSEWWHSVCPANASDCRISAWNPRAPGRAYDKYTLSVEYDGYKVEVSDKTTEGVYQKALRMIGDKPEFRHRKDKAEVRQVAAAPTSPGLLGRVKQLLK